MISGAKIAANRRNAQKSTGPRSGAGKARVGRNAFRHGLAVPITRDVFNADLIEPLARELAGEAAGPAEQEHAQLTAEAEAEILRVRQAKADLLNRAAQRLNRADADLRMPDEIMAMAFIMQLNTLSAFDPYERRALSKRKRALWALTAAKRAREARERVLNTFFETVQTVDVMAVVRAALPHSPDARYPEPSLDEVRGTTLNLQSDGLVRADAFTQRHDAASGHMYLQLTYDGDETLEQVFAIVKSSTGVGGGRWNAICPTTGKSVTKLYLGSGARMVRSRHAMNLHYRSKGYSADRQRGKCRQEEPSQATATGNYAAIVAAVSQQTRADRSFKTGPIPEQTATTVYHELNRAPGLTDERAITHPEIGPDLGSLGSVDAVRQPIQPPRNREHEICALEKSTPPSPDVRAQQSSGEPISMPSPPTPPLSPTKTDVEVGPPSIEAGDRLAAEGKPDEALVMYHRYIAHCQAMIEKGSSLRAFDGLNLTARQIGRLAPQFLLVGKFEQALHCADEALARISNWSALEIARAHALMFLGYEEKARSLYLHHRHTTMSPGKTYARSILKNFADLRQAGRSHPLMDEIERKFTRAKAAKKNPLRSLSLRKNKSSQS